MRPTSDVVIVGAGSVGLPTAYFLAQEGFRVTVFDPEASGGRGENRAAIGGIRATFSDRAKIAVCQESLDLVAGWEARTGDPVGWRQGGYVFVAYDPAVADTLKGLLDSQKAFGLGIDWLDAEALLEVAPGLSRAGLLGGTFSPGDGSASPLLCAWSYRKQAAMRGVDFHFHEPVTAIRIEGGRVVGVETPLGRWDAPVVLVAAGAAAARVGRLAGLELPVVPDSHEAGITEPVARFLEPMIVDVRPQPGSRNFYYYQNAEGQVVFCITPDPSIVGEDRRSTSAFLPLVARRMVAVEPALALLKVRRTWRGLYPMTPDGAPLVGPAPGVPGLVLAVGMCGQGFMIGPGLGALLTRLVADRTTERDREVLQDWRPDRPFGAMEALR
ncbi:MAG: FAD-binding oxidoreductase [Deltaproteobacteria bacterium]|nr:FAD-binding oxidoreductase [Deltaproteobacteria bacterium]